MKKRLDETNNMRKLMGLPLITEQENNAVIDVGDTSTSVNIPIGQDHINSLKQSLRSVSSNPEVLLPIVLGIGAASLEYLIIQISRKVKGNRLEKILNALNIVLENELDEGEIECLTDSLQSVGNIRSLNSKRKSEKVIYWMSSCIGKERATDIKDKFDEAVNRIGEKEGD